ncbi:hypothetical protein FE257_007689 [Aspergillus nanangensis]|uniref:Xylanolytic transcriptional activator regulatory domain-containing protein n=1 Tax=Aspergillus nanangensis TaxID=2582783 RepID=A0AAD4CX93_ASPNN|nr:hypothetical protein FE257_007689 [Aspergillus nanangensis]
MQGYSFAPAAGPPKEGHKKSPLAKPLFTNARTQEIDQGVESGVFGDNDQSTAENLSEVLAPYIRQQRRERAEPEVSSQDEAEEMLPPLNTGAGSSIRIPPELMPSEDEAMNYFKIYFNDIHPYVPVIHRSHFYYQWQHERHLISPLLLEALFACAGRLSDDPAQGAQWLALANRHESSFMDVPRLSTIQAFLLLLKARESLPKKGYYYRSWQMVKTIVSMSKDLDIHEHYNAHAEQRECDLNIMECLIQTRVWQALLIVEVMIGAPQGRSDYGVDLDTVNMHPASDIKGLDQFEIDRSRQYSSFVQNAGNIRVITDIYHKIKKQKDWGANPKFVEKGNLHMRILEQCSAAWPMPEIQAQVDSLRLAFSADTNRSFELKPSFPYGSPSEPYHPSPPPLDSQYHGQINQIPSGVQSRVGYTTYPVTPPISAGTEDSKSDSSQLQPLGLIPSHPVPGHSIETPLVDENSWDPTRIINQWDMAFSMAPSTINSPPMALTNTVQPADPFLTRSNNSSLVTRQRLQFVAWVEMSLRATLIVFLTFPFLGQFEKAGLFESRKVFRYHNSRGNQSGSTSTSSPRPPKKSNFPPANLAPRNANSDRPRPRRVFDARSLGAPQAGGQSGNVLRSPKPRTNRNGPPAHARRSRPPTRSSPSKDKRGPRRRAPRQLETDGVDMIQKQEIEKVYQELAEGAKQAPARYRPQQFDINTLRETWPTLPTSVAAHTAGVVEKLSLMSERYPNAHHPSYELGKRLFKGQYVRFLNEKEKSEAMAEAQKLSQQRADQYSQRKGDLVEPETVGFNPASAETQKSLVQTLVQGNYPRVQASSDGKSPVLGEILRNLDNNETYRTAGKNSQFMAKVESLLTSSRPAKRA